MPDFLEALANILEARQAQNGANARTVNDLNPLKVAGDAWGQLGEIGQGIAGLLSLPAVAVQADIGDPNNPVTQYSADLVGRHGEPGSRDKFLHALMHPGQLNEDLQHSPDPLTSWLSGGAEMSADPRNLIPLPVGELGKLLRVGKAKAALVRLLQGVPEAEVGRVAEGAAQAAADLPLVPKAGDYRKFVGGAGLPVPGAGAFDPLPASDLTPKNFDIFRAAKAPQPWVTGQAALPENAAPTLANLLADVPTPAPAPKLADYEDFLQAARGVTGELPGAASSFWRRIGADPATVQSFFERGARQNLLGLTDAGAYAVKPGALARFVPSSTQGKVQAWVAEAYGPGAGKAWPNLLKKLGAEVTPEGIMRGDQDITEPVLHYLTDRPDLNKAQAATRYQQLLDDITPALDEVLPNPDLPKVGGDMGVTVSEPWADGHGNIIRTTTYGTGATNQVADLATGKAFPSRQEWIRQNALSQYGAAELPNARELYEAARDEAIRAGKAILPEDRPDWMRTKAEFLRREWGDESIPAPPDIIASVTREHRGIVQEALAEGRPVPAAVLHDYPGIEAAAAHARLSNEYSQVAGDLYQAEQALGVAKGKKKVALQSTIDTLRTRYQALEQQLRGGGDIAAGGGGMGIAPYVLPHGVATTLAGSGVGGLSGAGAGGLAGFAQADGDFGDRLHGAKEGALTGALVGAGIGGLGGATLAKNTTGDAARMLVQKANAAGVAGTKAAFTGARVKPTSFKGLTRYWAGQVVRHPKNIFNDELWSDLVTGALTPRSRQYVQGVRTSLIERMDQADPYDRLSAPVQDLMATFGRAELPDLGVPLAKSIEDEGLTIGQEALYSTALSALNPQGYAQNALGLIAGGPVKATANTWWRPFFTAANGTLNNTFREAALVGEAGKFAALGRQALIDAGHSSFKALPEDGLISAADVASHLGTREAAVWKAMQDNAWEMAQDRVKFLFGDYGKKSLVERATGGVIPFASWVVRAYPVALEMALEHPLIATAGIVATRQLAEGAGQNGRPGYTAGMLPIRDEAGLLTGGQPGTSYLDIIGSISPVGGDMFAPSDDAGRDKNAYQAITEGLQRLGLPGPNPLVQSLAYILGFDFKGPGALSRTQGMENAIGLIPGNPNLPDIGGGGLRALRGLASPLVAGTEIGQLLGADADPTPEQYDPVGRRFSELVVERTGRRLNDPANQAYLLDLAFGRGDLYAQAEREALLGGAARNIASMSSPVGVATQTDTARHAREATRGNPFDFGAVEAQPQGTAGRREVERQRKAALASDPWIEPYSIGGKAEANDLILQAILDRYRMAGARPTQAGIAEQLRLMNERAERQRIP